MLNDHNPMKDSLNSYPLVSVGVPLYNEEKYVYDTLNSIHIQKYPNMEVLISDNASTDKTWDIITEFLKKDSRFKSVRQAENMGGIANFHYVLNLAKGEFFIWMGGHDLWGPDMIESLVSTFLDHPDVVLCAPRTRWIDHDGNVLFEKEKYLDTRLATSPAGRVLLFLKQRERCNAIYGLHRRETLLKSFPWPNESDLIGLFRIASFGNLLSDPRVYWCRRNQRYETLSVRMARYTSSFGRSGLFARFPYLSGTIATFLEIVSFKGKLADRLKLILYYLRNVVFASANLKDLIADTTEGFLRK